MTVVKNEIEIIIDAIKLAEGSSLVFDIENTYKSDDGPYFYTEFEYQVDDRIPRIDKDIETVIEKKLGEGYGVIVQREDAFPNGYAAYKVIIDREQEEFTKLFE